MKAPVKIFVHVPTKTHIGRDWTETPSGSSIEYARCDLVADFADVVRRYVNPKKGDAFCSRSELMQKLNELQKLVEYGTRN